MMHCFTNRLSLSWMGKIKALFLVAGIIFALAPSAQSGDLQEVKDSGVLRHLGIEYANFVTGSGDGLDVELMQLFAKHLGVRYEFVRSTFADIIGDLTGRKVRVKGDDVEVLGEAPVKGDIIANGFTVLPWRQIVLDYSTPIFPTQVWLVAKSTSPIQPIKPTGSLDNDIIAVKSLIKGHTILGMTGTCLDPSLYNLEAAEPRGIQLFEGGLNELAPAVMNGEAEATILDVPDALVAMEKWPAEIKIIGPLSGRQEMACAFAKTSPRLREAFNQFFEQCKKDGTYMHLVEKYYPDVYHYYPEFFESMNGKR